MLIYIALALYVFALTAAAYSDVVRYEIPNALSLALLAAFALLVPMLPLAAAAAHLSAGIAVLIAGTLFFVAGLWGGGDAKLAAAASVWMGWNELAAFVLLTAIVGAVLALVLLAVRRMTAGAPALGRWYSRVLARDEGIPYGVAIATAALALTPRLGLLDMTGPA